MTTPRAVFEDRQGVRRVSLANAQAERAGIVPGLSINAALALVPALHLEERDPEKEQKLLKKLAAWAERYTSTVSIETPDLLLLEITGSLRLFGDVDCLRERIREELLRQGFTGAVAVAPTPLASVWLARAGENVSLESVSKLAGTLAPLPLRFLEWPDTVRESLHGMGLYCIGDCLRLPRQGFAQRFGAARLLQLDRALARMPDPRKSYRAPERFCTDCELVEEQSDSELLLQWCRHLLSKLERFLTTRQVAVQHVRFSFFHLREAATHLTLGCAQTGRNTAQWLELLAIKFERLNLPAPVILIRLQSGRVEPLQAVTERLHFDGRGGRRRSASITHLMERLSARMGEAAVHGVTLVPEHRPHYVWRAVQTPADRPAQASPQSPAWLTERRRSDSLRLQRPLWMLREPQALAAEQGHPAFHGALKLLDGPERLETGWWDGRGISRDYFVAANSRGMHLWIYQNREPNGTWYLHGLFG